MFVADEKGEGCLGAGAQEHPCSEGEVAVDELEGDVSMRKEVGGGVIVKRISSKATIGGVLELWVRGLDFRLGRRLETSIALTGI